MTHLTHAGTPPTPATLARHLRKHVTHATHASMPPTQARHATHASTPSTSPTLARIERYFSNFCLIMDYYHPELFMKNVFHVHFIKRLHQYSCH